MVPVMGRACRSALGVAAMVLLALGCPTTCALALERVDLAVGSGDGADLVRVSVVTRWPGDLWQGSRFAWQANVEFSGAAWRAGHFGQSRDSLFDIGVTPVLRFVDRGRGEMQPFIEAGIGVHLLSRTVSNPDAQLSTRFEFGDLVGIGLTFGSHGRFEIGFRYVHFSNGGMREPNHGANLNMLRVGYRF